jgi:hypothetical protein
MASASATALSGSTTSPVRWCLEHSEQSADMGQRGRRFAEQQYDRTLALARFSAVLQPFQSRKKPIRDVVER